MVEEREGLENKGENGVRELELEVMNKTKELSCMEEAAKVKDDLLQISEAARNSLEIDGLQKQAQIEKFMRIFGNMTTKIKRLEEDASVGNGMDVKGKVKKLIDELKEKSKKLEDSGKRNSDLMKKFGEETNLRAKAEAEVIRANKLIDYLHEELEVRRSSGATSASFLGQGNPGLQHSRGQAVGGAGLQLATAGGQLYLHQGGQTVRAQPVLGLYGGQPTLQHVGIQGGLGAVPQGFQPGVMQGVQLGSQGGQLNHQQVGLGGWMLR